MKIKCYSVKLQSLVAISNKAYKAIAFDGSYDIIPSSQIFGIDMDVQKSEAWWISAWILERKNLHYSKKKTSWFDSETGKFQPSITIIKHKPSKVSPVENNEITSLKSE